MIHHLLKLLILLSMVSHGYFLIPLDPHGENVCLVEEKFNVTVDVEEDYLYQYRVTEWCFSIPPRCTKYKSRWAKRKVPKVVEHSREVAECCSGYVPNGTGCRPFCKHPCRHGACIQPDKCFCFPGFRGPLCHDICRRGTWGTNCTEKCECQNDAYCNAMNGVCVCTPGWRGKRCSDPCANGFFGFECRMPCYCDGSPCHHITGECFYPTTISTTVTSSTESTTETESTSPTTEVTLSTTTATSNAYNLIYHRSTTEFFSTTSESTSHYEESTTTSTSLELSSSTFSESVITTEELERDESTVPPKIEGLIVTIIMSVFASVVVLVAAASFAMARKRKIVPTSNTHPDSDIGLYRFYAEEPLPVKTILVNPTYGRTDDGEIFDVPNLSTFREGNDTFTTDLRDILEAEYDHPQTSGSPYHLYAELNLPPPMGHPKYF